MREGGPEQPGGKMSGRGPRLPGYGERSRLSERGAFGAFAAAPRQTRRDPGGLSHPGLRRFQRLYLRVRRSTSGGDVGVGRLEGSPARMF